MITCKFLCDNIKELYPGGKEVTFVTQYDPNLPEDQRFTKATPTGKMIVVIDNPAALAELEVGKYYFVDLRAV